MQIPASDLLAWHRRIVWLFGAEPNTELLQATQEGRDLGALARTLARLSAEAETPWESAVRFQRWLKRVGETLDAVQASPFRKDHPFVEPDDLAAIRRERPRPPATAPWRGSRREFGDRLQGALLGRIAGCMLGKPVEGWWRADIEQTARATGNWPLTDYLRFPTAAEARKLARIEPRTRLHSDWHRTVTLPAMHGMVEDDDINYTVIGFGIVRQYGPGFSPLDVAEYWGKNVPILHTCTAERVAYRNLFNGILPPHSASFRNPYREWIGAQIRADYFGYANPGNPVRAAEWAWRDARISHVKNGIYGEMWVAAMLAAAFTTADWETVIHAGLAQIPRRCRLRADVLQVVEMHRAGASYDEAVAAVHARWDERRAHDWCHTNSNAQLVAIGLLYGEDDYSLTITRAVMPGFDTDCNGATCGSLWGAMHGTRSLPPSWTRPLADTVRTGVDGWHETPISKLAGAMTDLAWKHRA